MDWLFKLDLNSVFDMILSFFMFPLHIILTPVDYLLKQIPNIDVIPNSISAIVGYVGNISSTINSRCNFLRLDLPCFDISCSILSVCFGYFYSFRIFWRNWRSFKTWDFDKRNKLSGSFEQFGKCCYG